VRTLAISLIYPRLEVLTRLYTKASIGTQLGRNARSETTVRIWLPSRVQKKTVQWRHSLYRRFRVCTIKSLHNCSIFSILHCRLCLYTRMDECAYTFVNVFIMKITYMCMCPENKAHLTISLFW